MFQYRAGQAWSQGDYAAAQKWAAFAYRSNPESITAAGMMADLADLADRQGNPQAVIWRQRVVQLNPVQVDYALAWAQSALLYGNLSVAQYALKQLENRAAGRADFHSLLGTCALRSDRWMDADRAYQKALELEPSNPVHAMNLYTLRLMAGNPDVVADSRRHLTALLEDPVSGLEAARGLFQDAARRGDWPGAGDYARKALANPRASFTDRLNELRVLSRLSPEECAKREKPLVGQLEKDPENIAPWIHWMNEQGREREVLDWLKKCGPGIRNRPDLLMARSNLLIRLKAWQELEDFLRDTDLGGQDFMKQLMLLKIRRELSRPGFAEDWARLLETIGKSTLESIYVAEVAMDWGWTDESMAILKKLPDSDNAIYLEASSKLAKIYRQQGNTVGLFELENEHLKRFPDNSEHANNYAYLGLLLGTPDKRITTLARKNHERYPSHPAAAATWALALYRQDKLDEALRVMEKLPPGNLDLPGPAFCYGVLLAKKGDSTAALHYFELARKVSLLPEEKAWMDRYAPPSK